MGAVRIAGQTFDCSLAHGDAPGRCSWCGAALTGRARRWCAAHRNAWPENHAWTNVREAALRRDGRRCVRCGSSPQTIPRPVILAKRPPWPPPDGDVVAHRAALFVYHEEVDRTLAGWRRACDAARLEVNHIVPILGRHAQHGCHHHLDGVETLCRACHLAETARQFGHRSAVAADQGALL